MERQRGDEILSGVSCKVDHTVMSECENAFSQELSELPSSPSAVRPFKANATMMSLPQPNPAKESGTLQRVSLPQAKCANLFRLLLVRQQPGELAFCGRMLFSHLKFMCSVSVQTSFPCVAKEMLCSTIRQNLPLSNYCSPFKDLGKGQNNTLSFRWAAKRED